MKFPYKYRWLAVGLAVVFFWIQPAIGEELDRKLLEPAKAAPSQQPEIITLSEVPMQASVVSDFLRTVKMQLAPSPEIEAIEKDFPQKFARIDTELASAAAMLRNHPSLSALQVRQEFWKKVQLEMSGWLSVIGARATGLQEALRRLKDLRGIWGRTLGSLQGLKAHPAVVQQVESIIVAIETMQRELQPQRDSVLDLHARVADEAARSDNMLAEIAEAQRKAVDAIMERGLPIWSPDLWALNTGVIRARAREVLDGCMAEISEYIHDPSKGMPFHLFLFFIVVPLFHAARRKVHARIKEGRGAPDAARVFDRPFASALLVPLVVGSSVYLVPAPPMVRLLFLILAVVPIIRVVQPVVSSSVVPGLCVLGGLFALDTIRQIFDVASSIERVILLLEILSGLVVLGKLGFLPGRLRLRSMVTDDTGLSALQIGVALYQVGLVIALPATLFGYLPLARLFTSAIFGGFVLALGLYASVRVIDGLLALALDSRSLQRLHIVACCRELLARRTHRVLVWMMVAGWTARSLDYVGLLQPVRNVVRSIFGTSISVGSISISLKHVLAFILTMLVAYMLSSFIRFVLQEDLYPRMGVERGVSYAVSSLLHYTILALGFILGASALGVNFTQLSILAGALGVGIGFGLQSAVNNFVSGLILLFEQPIHVGDTVEIGDLLGEVRRIGMRASTVHTRTGADIIVPNAQLVTERVTNWTLSDRLRRIDLAVGLNYGADPRKAMELLERVARSHPNVLRDPAPQALLHSYGDSSINYELRAWTDQVDQWPIIRSDLASAVYDAVREAGMQFPFPQRDVHLVRDAEEKKK